MFQPVEGSVKFPELEDKIGRFWKAEEIYEKSLAQRAGAPRFVFFEGPPTANGMPHPGHCLTRAMKDLFPRYKTMRGMFCERKAGWDTHGLPVEVEVCKELGIHSKEEIEAYGIEPFIQKCQQSVWRYMQEWERLTERLGFWIRLDEAYVTYHQSYVESVWWSLKNLFDRGLLYQGHKILWWWAQGGTALSAGEVGQGYREVADPSVYVKFPLLDESGEKTDTSLLVWTTTPWTLPSNQFAAVNPKLTYATVVDGETGDRLILAADLVETIAGKVKRELTVESTCLGTELLGRRYVPPFVGYYDAPPLRNMPSGVARRGDEMGKCIVDGTLMAIQWRVVGAEFVTTDSGSGVVHQAPAFGEVDYEVLLKQQENFREIDKPLLINAVAPDGKFTDEGPEYCRGRWVKECDKEISRDLKDRGLLYHLEQYLHDYPFCWRADEDPLIQYPRESWFIKTTEFKDQMLANNQQINWLPEHIKDGRFGNFLESNVDWALSRERYWGTPLPIWVCEESGVAEAIGNYDELLAKQGVTGTEVWEEAKAANPELPEDLKIHKPYIDAVTYDSPFAEGARMQRVTEVIDCWYDSGAMPFAQWGYQGEDGDPVAAEKFREQFPADFISEAIDQTRGWFYSQLAISTMIFGDGAEENSKSQKTNPNLPAGDSLAYPHPYRNCIVLGLMLGEDGNKMSKSKRNYREPNEIFDRYGADALRWYFFANQPPWTGIRYSEQAIKESIPEFLLRLWNVFSFFVIYANIDGFDPAAELDGEVGQFGSDVLSQAKSYRPLADRRPLDQWIISELNRTTLAVVERMDAYDNFAACQFVTEFVDSLSNWYVRRSRERFWLEDKQDSDKLDAYWTLYECLTEISKLVAPFVPHLAEALWQNLTGVFGTRAAQSVHLCDYPTGDASLVDEQLGRRMALGREISSLGRAARMEAKLKVRQPLAKVEVILANPEDEAWLNEYIPIICEELNVKEVEFTDEADKYITYQVQPDFRKLGPKLGKLIPAVKKMLGDADGAALLAQLKADGKVTLDVEGNAVELTEDEIQVRLQAKEGWAAAQGTVSVVVLSTEITPELAREGLIRDLVRSVQDGRKEIGCEFTDRIEIGVVTDDAELAAAIEQFAEFLKKETLAVSLVLELLEGVEPIEVKLGDSEVKLFVRRKTS